MYVYMIRMQLVFIRFKSTITHVNILLKNYNLSVALLQACCCKQLIVLLNRH